MVFKVISLGATVLHNTMPSSQSHWSAQAAAELSGLGIHMLNYLERQHVLRVPARLEDARPHHGLRRDYLFGDIVIMRALRHLTQRGVSVLRLKAAWQALRPEHFRITEHDAPHRFLLTTGEEVTFSAPETLYRDLDRLGKATIVLDIEGLRQEVLQEIETLPQKVS